MAFGFFSTAYTTISRFAFIAARNEQRIRGPRPAPTKVMTTRSSGGMRGWRGIPPEVEFCAEGISLRSGLYKAILKGVLRVYRDNTSKMASSY